MFFTPVHGHRDFMAGLANGLVVAIFALGCGGCLIPVPLAVFPAPCRGSWLKLEFRDRDGKKIDKDGLLVVHRQFYHTVTGDRPTFDDVVEIKNGRATIPMQVKLAALVWTPEFPLVIFGMPIVFPIDSLEIAPLIPDYDGSSFAELFLFNRMQGNAFDPVINFQHINDGIVEVRSIDGDEAAKERMRKCYEYIYARLWCEHEKVGRSPVCDHEFFLPNDDYFEVRQFLETELSRHGVTISTSRKAVEH